MIIPGRSHDLLHQLLPISLSDGWFHEQRSHGSTVWRRPLNYQQKLFSSASVWAILDVVVDKRFCGRIFGCGRSCHSVLVIHLTNRKPIEDAQCVDKSLIHPNGKILKKGNSLVSLQQIANNMDKFGLIIVSKFVADPSSQFPNISKTPNDELAFESSRLHVAFCGFQKSLVAEIWWSISSLLIF